MQSAAGEFQQGYLLEKVYTITIYQEEIYISGGGFVRDLSSWVHRKVSMML